MACVDDSSFKDWQEKASVLSRSGDREDAAAQRPFRGNRRDLRPLEEARRSGAKGRARAVLAEQGRATERHGSQLSAQPEARLTTSYTS